MGFIKKSFQGSGWLLGKTVKGTTYVLGYTASGVADLVSDNKKTGANIRQRTKEAATSLDRGTKKAVELTGMVVDKSVDVAERGTQKAIELGRPGGRRVLINIKDKVRDEDFARRFTGFDPPLDDWSVDEANALLGIWETKGTALHKDLVPSQNVKIALEYFAMGAGGLLFGKKPIHYADLVKKTLAKLKIKHDECLLEGQENALIRHIWKEYVDKMKPDDLERLRKNLKSNDQLKSMSSKVGADLATALTVAQLSGFGVYLAASTIVGAMTHAAGTTLPFAFYTGMSSTISAVIGPAGFATAVAIALVGSAGTNWKEIVTFIIYNRAIRDVRKGRYQV